MPRKKRTKKKAEPQTYFQAKNKRWYKRIVVDGKTRCRFVSTAEATGQIKPKPAASKASQAKPTGTSSPPPPTSQTKTRKSSNRRKRNDDAGDAPSLNDE